MTRFADLPLTPPLLQAIAERGLQRPTPIQQRAIPAILDGRDLMAVAETGSGKSAAFLLPLLQRLADGKRAGANRVRVLVLAPTRELAIQLADEARGYGGGLNLSIEAVYGGVKINPQMMRLRGGADLLVATPGRLLDLQRQNALRLDRLESLVLDEADRMLDLGFSDELTAILALLPERRQTLLLSATLAEPVRALARRLLQQPLTVDLSPRRVTARKVQQAVYEVDKGRKGALLSHLIRDRNWQQLLVFTRTKNGADKLVTRLRRDAIEAAAIHGDKSQGARNRALADFKNGAIRVLVATDLAARGIDIAGLPQVVNHDLPKVAEDYVHRIGRTGRAGRDGEAISLVSADEVKLLQGIEDRIQQTLVREQEPGFVPSHQVPLTRHTPGGDRPKRPKKPKKSKETKPAGRSDAPAGGKGQPSTKRGKGKGDRRPAPALKAKRPVRGGKSGSKRPSGKGRR